MFTPPPERCSSPAAVPGSLLRHSQERATGAADSYPPPTRTGSPVAAPFRVSLQRLPVAAGKLVGEKPTACYVAPPARYSTDNLRTSSTPHGPKYACTLSKSAGSSPLPPAAAAAPVRACDHVASAPAAAAGIAATWLGHLPPPSAAATAADTSPLTTAARMDSNSSSSSSGSSTCTLPSIQQEKAAVLMRHQRSSPSLPALQQQCDDASMEQIIKDPVSHLMHQTDAATAAGLAAEARAVRQAAQTDHGSSSSHQAATSNTYTSTSAASSQPSVQVFSRNRAIQLEADLQALPRGQLLAAQQQHLQAWSTQQQQQWQRQLQADPQQLQCFQQHLQQQQQQQQYSLGLQLVAQQLLPGQQHTSRLMQQLTEQVAFHCVEHGRTLEALQDRHTELANALFHALHTLSQHHAALTAAAEASASGLLSSRSRASDLQQQLSAQQAETQAAQQQLAALTAEHQQLQEDSQESLEQLQQLVTSLKEQLWQARSDLEKQAADAQLAAAQEAATASRLLTEAEDESADLRERLAFVHAQLQVLKAAQRVEPDTASVAVQTEPEQPVHEPEAAVADQPPAEASSGDDTDTEDSLEDAPDMPKAINLLEFVARGTRRSRLWLVKLVGQVTSDKAVADAVADRQGLARSSMRDFVPAWSLNRYGLQHLSDQVLGDLCASICHHAAAGLLPARWFACFCGLGPALKPKKKQRLLGPWQLPGRGYTGSAAAEQGAGGGSGRASPAAGGSHSHKALRGLSGADAEVLLGSAAAADFWMFCACQLAYPNSVVALFPEAQEALIRSNLAMESIKAAFRYLVDPSGQAQFVAEKLDLAAVPADTATTGAAAGGSAAGSSGSNKAASSSRPSTGGSVVGRFGFYDAWALLDLLLAEWLGRAWGRARTMGRLRRAVPWLQQQYEAAVAAASASDSVHAALLDKLQDAYAGLLALAPDLLPAASNAAGAESSVVVGPSPSGQELGEGITQGQAPAAPQAEPAGGTEDPAAQLLQDAAAVDAEGAWRAYKQLMSLVQTVLPAAEGTDANSSAGVGADAAAEPAGTGAVTPVPAAPSRATTAGAAQERQQACSQAGIVLNEKLQRKLVAAGVMFAQGVACSSSGDGGGVAEAAAASLAQQLAQSGALSSALAAALAERAQGSSPPSLKFL